MRLPCESARVTCGRSRPPGLRRGGWRLSPACRGFAPRTAQERRRTPPNSPPLWCGATPTCVCFALGFWVCSSTCLEDRSPPGHTALPGLAVSDRLSGSGRHRVQGVGTQGAIFGNVRVGAATVERTPPGGPRSGARIEATAGRPITPRRSTIRRFHTQPGSWDEERIMGALREWTHLGGVPTS